MGWTPHPPILGNPEQTIDGLIHLKLKKAGAELGQAQPKLGLDCH